VELFVSTDRETARTELGTLIRKQRYAMLNARGRRMTQQQLAELLGCSQGHVQKMEAGSATVKPEFLEKIITVLDVDKTTASAMWAQVAWGSVGETYSGGRVEPPYAREFFRLEAVARSVRSWHELRLPGTVQSQYLMLKQFEAAGCIDVKPLERTRRDRRQIFRRKDLESYACLLFEDALHRAAFAFGRLVVLDQIDHLLALNDPDHPTREADDRTSIRIVPATTSSIHLPGDFTIVEHKNRTLVYMENVLGADKGTSPAHVRKANEAWLRIESKALTREETNDFLRKLRERFAGG
jgi:transcriptional regulator with XRE-family HTH domain